MAMPVAPPLLDPDPPPLPPAAVVDALRVVPLAEVFALDEMLPVVLAVPSVVAEPDRLELLDRAEDPLTEELPIAVLTLEVDREELADAGELTPAVAEGDRRAFPVAVEPPAPAPEEEPAVLEPPAEEEELLVADDCT